MALTGFAKEASAAAQPLPNLQLSVQLPGGATHTMEFRAPSVAEMFAAGEQAQRYLVRYPDFHDSQLRQSIILGLCYVLQPEDSGSDPVDAICQLARAQPGAWIAIATQFADAFPGCFDFAGRVETVKNADPA